MKKGRKLKTGGIITLVLGVTLLTMGLISKKEEDSSSTLYPGEQIDLEVQSNGKIEVKKLSQSTNEEGQEEISFSFGVYPEEANDQTVTIALSWIDDTVEEDINEYLTYARTSYYVITLTCLKRANHQAQLTITSNSNPDVKAVIKIDFNRQFQGFKTTEIAMTKEITTMEDTTYSKEDLVNEITKQSLGFGEGTRYSSSPEISNLIIKENLEKHSYLCDVLDGIDKPSYLVMEDIVLSDQFLETLSMCYGKPFGEIFINSDAENDMRMQPAQGRDEIADARYLAFYTKTRVDFTFYGESYSFTFRIMHMVKTEIFTDYLIIPVSSIDVEISNIVF